MRRLERHMNLQRLLLCIKRDMKPNSRSFFVVLGAAVGFLLIISALDVTVGDGEADFHRGIFFPVLFIGGFIFTSGIFREVHGKETNLTYLMLPASALEKVVSRLLLASIGWVVFSLAWYTAYAALSEGINALFFGRTHRLFVPFSAEVISAAAHYMVLQSVFLLGAIFFRKLHFFKTVLVGAAFGIFLALAGGLTVRLAFADYFTGSLMMGDGNGLSLAVEQFTSRLIRLDSRFEAVKDLLYWVAFPLFCWVLVYIRFREVQIKDGV